MEVEPPIEPSFSWRRAPQMLADRLGMRPAGLIFSTMGVLAVGLAAWWALRPPPPPPEDSLPFVHETSVAPTSSTTVPSPDLMVVHVDGAVHRPGIHELVAGARVADALEAAGGVQDDADGRALNLAQRVGDGQRLWVPRIGDPQETPVISGGTGTTGAESGGAVSLSTAPASVLETLHGIGPSLAAAIVDYRDRHGAFGAVDDLLAVPGIGPAKLDALRDQVVP